MEGPKRSISTPPSAKPPTVGKMLLFVFLGIITISVIVFIILFGYYLWVQKYGDQAAKQALNKQFSSQFTVAPNAVDQSDTVSIDAKTIIRPHNPQYGNPDATVTIIAFIDFECPFCQEAYPTFETIRDRFGPAVQIVFKHFPIEQIHPQANIAARAAQCAHNQQAFWPYYQQLFSTKVLTDGALLSYAKNLNLPTTSFAYCIENTETYTQVQTDIQDGITVGVRGTPTYIINQTKVEGVISLQDWESLILSSLNK